MATLCTQFGRPAVTSALRAALQDLRDQIGAPSVEYLATNTLWWLAAATSAPVPKSTVPEKAPATATLPLASRATA